MSSSRLLLALVATLALTGCGVAEASRHSDKPSGTSVVTGYLAIYGGAFNAPSTGIPQPGGTVRWTNTATGKVFAVHTEEKGTYEIRLPAGTYRVIAGNGRGWPTGSCDALFRPSAVTGTVRRVVAGSVRLASGEHLVLNVGCIAL